MGFRTYYFVKADNEDYGSLTKLIADQFFVIEPLQKKLDEYRMVDNALVLELSSNSGELKLQFGPIGREESKTKGWLRTDYAMKTIPDPSFAIDVDTFQSFSPPPPKQGRDISRFVSEMRRVSLSSVDALLDQLWS